jgi:hypothetical protein
VFGRAAKYSLFDPSKEMVFITMSKEEKEAGKAAVDVLGNQIGKTGGSWLMQVCWKHLWMLSSAYDSATKSAAPEYTHVCRLVGRCSVGGLAYRSVNMPCVRWLVSLSFSV